MLFGLVPASPKSSLKIVPYQGILHLEPRPRDVDFGPEETEQQTFWGTVVLYLHEPRDFKSLVVKLVASYNLLLPGEPCVESHHVRSRADPGLLQGRKGDTFSVRMQRKHTVKTGEGRTLVSLSTRRLPTKFSPRRFAWSLGVPRSSAPFMRNDFGRIDYKLLAIADGPVPLHTEHPVEVVASPALCVALKVTRPSASLLPLTQSDSQRRRDVYR